MHEKVPAARRDAGVTMLCSRPLDRAGRASEMLPMADEASIVGEMVETITTPFGLAPRCTAISQTTRTRCRKAAQAGKATCSTHGVGSAGFWSRAGAREDPRLFAKAGGAYRAPPDEVMMAFLAAQERTVRISRQAAEVDAISTELVRGILQGVVQLIYTFVPREREVEALNALYDWQASLLPGVVRL
jgi:hypothetical protein